MAVCKVFSTMFKKRTLFFAPRVIAIAACASVWAINIIETQHYHERDKRYQETRERFTEMTEDERQEDERQEAFKRQEELVNIMEGHWLRAMGIDNSHQVTRHRKRGEKGDTRPVTIMYKDRVKHIYYFVPAETKDWPSDGTQLSKERTAQVVKRFVRNECIPSGSTPSGSTPTHCYLSNDSIMYHILKLNEDTFPSYLYEDPLAVPTGKALLYSKIADGISLKCSKSDVFDVYAGHVKK